MGICELNPHERHCSDNVGLRLSSTTFQDPAFSTIDLSLSIGDLVLVQAIVEKNKNTTPRVLSLHRFSCSDWNFDFK
jgi:hypothetical protein